MCFRLFARLRQVSTFCVAITRFFLISATMSDPGKVAVLVKCESKSVSIKSIKEPMILFPLVMDAYLRDPVTWDMGAVALDEVNGSPYYQLLEKDTVCFTANKVIFHRATGLLFVPMPWLTYDSTNMILLNSTTLKVADPRANLVYDDKTLAVYERALALVAVDGNADSWSLARMPLSSTPFPAIRRAVPEELPLQYRAKYRELLDQQGHKLPEMAPKTSEEKSPPTTK